MNSFDLNEFSSMLLVTQSGDALPALTGGGGGVTAGEGADGSGGGGNGQGAAPPAGGLDIFILLIPIVLIFIFMIFSSSRKEKKRREQLNKIVKHDRIRTRGGIIGSVVEANDDQLVIKVDEGRDTRITLDRQYVDAILEGAGSGKD